VSEEVLSVLSLLSLLSVPRPRSTPARKPESIPRTSAALRVRAAGWAGAALAAAPSSTDLGVRRVRPPLGAATGGATSGVKDGA
jgi:hypothetical protein